MSRVVIRPGTGRYITDVPAHLLNPETDWAFAQDALVPDGKLVQRKGWAYDGTVADVAANLVGVWRVKFALANVTRTVTASAAGGVYSHNPAGAGTVIYAPGGSAFLPRAVFNDELILCATDGVTPLLRYCGDVVTHAAEGGAPIMAANENRITGGTLGATVSRGSMDLFTGASYTETIFVHARVLEAAAANIALEGVKATVAANPYNHIMYPYGYAYPAVAVYEAGTITVDGALNVTGYGTRWTDFGVAGTDALLARDVAASSYRHGQVGVVASQTSITNARFAALVTKSTYRVTRRLPFQDVAEHKNSLFGAGVMQFKNRVYISPPGWRPGFPPGAVLPIDLGGVISSSADSYFLLKYIDVPSPSAEAGIVALLSSPGPLVVLTREDARGVDGAFPDFSQRLIAAGAGCIDLRSAISVGEGLFWCGEGGIYWSPDGEQIIDLTDGKMNREWRALMRAAGTTFGSTSYVSCGVAHGHLVVSGSFGGTARSYLYDLRRREWMGRLSNLTARYMFSARISGEIEALYFVDDAEQGRVMNFAPAVNLSGIAKDGDGTSPSAQFHTAQNFVGEVNDEGRLLNVEVAANVYDTGAAGATQLDIVVEHSGGLQSGGAGVQTKTLTSIDSDATDLLDRHEREVNRSGRLHQLKFAVSPTGTNDANTKVEVSEIALSFREGRSGA